MPKFKNRKGFVPIILVIILTVVITGVAGVVYKSRNEIKVRSDKTSQTTELKGSPAPTPQSAEVNLANSGRLADKPFEQKIDTANAAVPKFSIYPPAGWEKVAPYGNIVVEFVSPVKDEISEGAAGILWTVNVRSSLSINIVKSEFKNLDDALESAILNKVNSTVTISQRQKIKVNGEEAYALESVMDIRETAQKILESQMQEELAKAAKEGVNVSRKDIQEDMDKVLQQAKVRILSYVFYKNGYLITVAGKAFEPYWDKRGLQLKQSMDTFKFE
ncbi:MAG: hypothetical protein Q7S45_00990 [Candidatus Curtissbacteria bacterium]|nr:hypothetical protein [Candidatus Curtissbacteria bacterium]